MEKQLDYAVVEAMEEAQDNSVGVFSALMNANDNTSAEVSTSKVKEPKTQRQGTATTRTSIPKSLTPEEIKTLMTELKTEQKARADAESAIEKIKQNYERTIEKMRLDHERVLLTAQKTAQAEVTQTKNYSDKAIKAAQAETAKIKVEAERDRAKAKKLYDTVIDKAKIDLERAVERQKRAEKTAIEKSSQAAERSRQVASLRMELSRERMKGSHITDSNGNTFGAAQSPNSPFRTQQQPEQPQNQNQQHANFNNSMPPLSFNNLLGNQMNIGQDQTIMQIQHMLAELVIRMRATPMQTVPNSGISPDALALLLKQPTQPTQPAHTQTDVSAISDVLKSHQEAMQAQINAMQNQQQAKIDELMRQQQAASEDMARKHQEAIEELNRKQRESEEELARKQRELDEEIASKKQAAEEELERKQQQKKQEEEEANEAWVTPELEEKIVYNPTVDEVAESLNDEIESRGGVIPSASISISDFLKQRDAGDSLKISSNTQTEKPEQTMQEIFNGKPKPAPISNWVKQKEVVEEKESEKVQAENDQSAAFFKAHVKETSEDALDDLIVSLSRELTELKNVLDTGTERKKK